ncbi:MAG: CoA transferase [Pseudomonadota bacterium]
MAQAFSGIRILDFSQVIAGPYAAQLCNMLGAEVIKIEQPGVGDQMRTLLQIDNPAYPDMSPGFISYNSGKRSLAIDLKAPDAHDVIMRLVKQSDVVVQNFRAGVIDKLGFGYEAIKAVKPDIVYCSISGYGQKGPKAGVPAYDGAVQAASGMMSCTGHPETGPTRVSYLPIDITTGITAAFSIASALFRRSQTGEGQYLDVAMLDAAVTLQSAHYANFLMGAPEPGLLGNTSPAGLPTADSFETADGHVLTSVITEAQVASMFKVLGLGAMLDDPRFRDNASRIANREDVLVALRAAFKSRSSDAWVDELQAARVPIAKVRSVSEVCADPQMETRGVIANVPKPGAPERSMQAVGASFVTNIDGPQVRAAAPSIGEHNNDVLSELGYSAAEIADLQLGLAQ